MKTLAQKTILLTTLLISITSVAITLVFYHSGKDILIRHAMDDLSSTARQEGAKLKAIVEELKNDTLFLAGTPPIQGLNRARQNNGYDIEGRSTHLQWQQRLENIFATLLHAKQHYLQVRLINAAGQEVVRMDRSGNNIVKIRHAELQDKSKAPYTAITLALNKEQIHLSAINLNREHGEISRPHTPVIRSATPIRDASGKVTGFVIINMNFGKELEHIEALYRQGNNELVIANERGQYLVHPDHNKRFGFELGHRYRVHEDHPRLARFFIPANTETTATLLPYKANQNAMVMVKLPFDSKHPERYLAIIVSRPYKSIIEDETAIIRDNLWIGFALVILSTLLAYTFIHRIVKPLQQITQGIEAFRQGDSNWTLPRKTQDEIGMLTTAFEGMMQQVASSETSLKELNNHLEHEVELRTAELHKSEQRWQFALEGSQQGVWDWNIVTNEVFFSKQWKAMLGFAENEIENSLDEWSQRVHPDDMPGVMSDIERHFSGETSVYKNEHRVLSKDGTYIWILDQGMVVERDSENQPIRMIGTHTDITERKHLDTMKNEFISTVSHELRTPLTSIRGSIGLLTGGAIGDLPDKADKLLNIAYKNTERLLLLINDILDLQKIESGQMSFDFKPLSLNDFIHEAIALNKPFADTQEVVLRFVNHLDKDVQLIADHDRLMQVMNNLLSNAAKFSPSTAVITIECFAADNMLTIAVSDQGPGIPENFRDKVFDKFTQSDSSDTRQSGGTGLGLSIAKLIVEKHNGQISYESEKGKGTTFYVRLPVVASTTNNDMESLSGNTQKIS